MGCTFFFVQTGVSLHYVLSFPVHGDDMSECMSYYSLDMNTDSNHEHHKTLNIAGNYNTKTIHTCILYTGLDILKLEISL